MPILPLIPDWHQIHPLIVHFPVALLLIAPVFIIIGILRPPQSSTPFQICALVLMIAGSAANLFAVRTGIAARSHTHLTREVEDLLQRHQDLAETTSLTFCVLTLVFAAIVLVPRLMSRPSSSRVLTTTLPAAFLLLYAGGAMLLAHTGHIGGCLVHEFGVTAVQGPVPHPPGHSGL